MYWSLTNKERFFEAIKLASQNPKLLKDFLEDLLTTQEMDQYSKRLEVMCLLYDLVPYSQISRVTGLSSTTIARISKIVSNKESGFRKIIEKFEKKGKSYSD
jgi:uncharacterized protein YerC